MQPTYALPFAQRAAVYRAIRERRDVRAFRPEPVPADVLWRILEAAHAAPSVGYMQPWNFLVLTDPALRRAIHSHFLDVNEAAAAVHPDAKGEAYRALKLQGILDAPLNLLVTCDRGRGGPHVLGRYTMPETDVYSTCLAVQNLWLAARAEGVGVGWMSLMEPRVIAELVDLPPQVEPVAYLCLGYPTELPDEPLLARVGWREREPLAGLVFQDRWGGTFATQSAATGADEADRAADVIGASVGGPVGEEEALAARVARYPTPLGALGRLADLAVQLADAQGRARPCADEARVLVMAGDHGVAAEEGVSAYEPQVTATMVYMFLAGGGVVNALARQAGAPLTVADLGVDHAFGATATLAQEKVRRGTRNFCNEAAMSVEEVAAAIAAGQRVLADLGPIDVVALGEVGIGNTTSAAALAAARLGLAPADVAGAGSGLGPQGRSRKADAIARALALHGEAAAADPTEALRRLGGLEIAGMVGAIEEAARRRIPVVLDGFIVGVAALIAVARTPDARRVLIAGTRSPEPAHDRVLAALGLAPLLDLGLRLGEASGAALALGLVQAACRVAAEVATVEEANVEIAAVPGARS